MAPPGFEPGTDRRGFPVGLHSSITVSASVMSRVLGLDANPGEKIVLGFVVMVFVQSVV